MEILPETVVLLPLVSLDMPRAFLPSVEILPSTVSMFSVKVSSPYVCLIPVEPLPAVLIVPVLVMVVTLPVPLFTIPLALFPSVIILPERAVVLLRQHYKFRVRQHLL